MMQGPAGDLLGVQVRISRDCLQQQIIPRFDAGEGGQLVVQLEGLAWQELDAICGLSMKISGRPSRLPPGLLSLRPPCDDPDDAQGRPPLWSLAQGMTVLFLMGTPDPDLTPAAMRWILPVMRPPIHSRTC